MNAEALSSGSDCLLSLPATTGDHRPFGADKKQAAVGQERTAPNSFAASGALGSAERSCWLKCTVKAAVHLHRGRTPSTPCAASAVWFNVTEQDFT